MLVSSNRLHEGLDGVQPAFGGRSAPAVQEGFGLVFVLELPELLEFVFEHPGPVDASVSPVEGLEGLGVLFGALVGVFVYQPPQTFECLPVRIVGFAPRLLANFVDGFVQGLDDMESIQDQGCFRTPFLDGADKGLAHVAAAGYDPISLVSAQLLFEEAVDGIAGFAFSDPDDARSLEIVYDGGVFPPLAVRDFVDTDHFELPDPMSRSFSADNPVQKVRHRRIGYLQQPGGRLLGHDGAVSQQRVFEPVGDAGIGRRPGNILLDPPMNPTVDFARPVVEKHHSPANGNVAPDSRFVQGADDPAPLAAVGAQGSVFERLYLEPKLPVPVFESETSDGKRLYFK